MPARISLSRADSLCAGRISVCPSISASAFHCATGEQRQQLDHNSNRAYNPISTALTSSVLLAYTEGCARPQCIRVGARTRLGELSPGDTSWLSFCNSTTSSSRFFAMDSSVSPLRTVYGLTCKPQAGGR